MLHGAVDEVTHYTAEQEKETSSVHPVPSEVRGTQRGNVAYHCVRPGVAEPDYEPVEG